MRREIEQPGQKEEKAKESHARHGMQVRHVWMEQHPLGLAPLGVSLTHDVPRNLLVPGGDVTNAIGAGLGLITRCRCFSHSEIGKLSNAWS